VKKIIFISLLAVTSLLFMYVSDGPNSWTQSLSSAGQIWGVAVAPSNQQVIYAASNSQGMWKSTNAGLNWTQMNTGLSNLILQCVAVSPSNANVVMCGSTNTGTNPGVYRSSDGGANWTRVVTGITETNINIQAIAIDPVNPSIAFITLFDGTTNSVNGIYKTTDGGALWVPVTTGIGAIKNFLSVAINPLNANVIYAGTSFDPLTSLGPSKVYKSGNGGTSWTDISTGLPSLTSDIKPIRQISISRSDTSVVLLGQFINTDTLGGGMYVTTNGGGLWQKRNSGLPVAVGLLPRSCAIRPGSSTELFVGLGNATNTTIGVYRSTDRGLSWSQFNNGLLVNTYTIRGLDFKTTGDTTIFAAVAHPTIATGQGVFEYSWPPLGISDPVTNEPYTFELLQNYPNPFNPATTIDFAIPVNSNVQLKIYNAAGKEVKVLINKQMSKGNYTVSFDGSELSSGIYFYKLISGDFTSVKKMVMIK
jgi:photosystem II stability/assembly factor-like uncharacterized protein